MLAAPALLKAAQDAKPNIVWITCEDLSPILGCYGDRYAATPNLDRFAQQGVRYANAHSTASVCSPSRSCLITGIPATTLGTQHLRGLQPLPGHVKCFTSYLREAGYYCSNNVKEDYNFNTPAGAWDESSANAHWRKRRAGQPFFSVFNLTVTHQGQIRYSREQFEKVSAGLPPELRHDPREAPVPPYYPDTPLVRLTIAALYTQASIMDRMAGEILKQLETDGLAANTIVFFYSDHGTGLPRGKRWLHDSGTRVPLLVRFPEQWKAWAPAPAGSTVERMVCFEDFAPAVLSLAGLPQPSYMRGQPFLGARRGREHAHLYFAADRVDEVIDMSRAVRNGRYLYIRNFMPHRPRMAQSDYSEVGLVRQEVRRLAAEGGLRGDAAYLAAPSKPVEELYDLARDPHQMNNLAGSAGHARPLKELREKLLDWMVERRDTGLLPEPEMSRRAAGNSPATLTEAQFPVRRILEAANLVGAGAAALPRLRDLLRDEDAAVRYWAAVSVAAMGGAEAARAELTVALKDPSPVVRIAAAEAAALSGLAQPAREALEKELISPDATLALYAAAAFEHLGSRLRPSAAALGKASSASGGPEYQRTYFAWALKRLRPAA